MRSKLEMRQWLKATSRDLLIPCALVVNEVVTRGWTAAEQG